MSEDRPFNTYRTGKVLLPRSNAGVYRAWDRVRKTDVVLKFFCDDQIRAGKEEAALIQDLNKHDWRPFFLDSVAWQPQLRSNVPDLSPYCFSLEYIPGIDCHRVFDPRRLPTYLPKRVGIALTAAVHIAADLEVLHDNGIIHRDIKPKNALLNEDGYFQLIDFGIAHRIGNDLLEANLGTLGYAAPEQVNNDATATCIQTDHWGVGATLYRMLTGTPLINCSERELRILKSRCRDQRDFDDEYDNIRMDRTHEFDADRLKFEIPGHWGIHASILRIMKRCLRHNPADRYTSTEELHHDLGFALSLFEREYGLIDHRPTSKPYGKEYYKFMQQERRRKAREKAKSQ